MIHYLPRYWILLPEIGLIKVVTPRFTFSILLANIME